MGATQKPEPRKTTEEIEAMINAAFEAHTQHRDRACIEATLAKIQRHSQYLRMPEQNYLSGYITGRFAALGETF